MSSPEGGVREPRQKRSQQTFRRVLEAGRDILEENGVEGFTVLAVSKRANVSVGSIYLRVESRQSLLLAIYDAETERLGLEEIDLEQQAAQARLPAREYVEAIAAQTASLMLRNSGILGAFMRWGVNDDAIWQRGQTRSQELAITFEAALGSVRDAIAHDDPELAIDFAFRIVYATTTRRITHGPTFESDREFSDEVFIREIALAVANYLLPGSA